jgi:hypothetical protein
MLKLILRIMILTFHLMTFVKQQRILSSQTQALNVTIFNTCITSVFNSMKYVTNLSFFQIIRHYFGFGVPLIVEHGSFCFMYLDEDIMSKLSFVMLLFVVSCFLMTSFYLCTLTYIQFIFVSYYSMWRSNCFLDLCPIIVAKDCKLDLMGFRDLDKWWRVLCKHGHNAY